MRNTILGIFFTASMFGVGLATANDNIAIDLSISGEIAPGVYGRVNIGDKHPQVVYEQPVIIQKERRESEEPVYLHVPPGHAKHWEKHCAEYNACDRRVYFVKSREYDEDYGREEHHEHGHHEHEHHDYDDHHDHEHHNEDHGHDDHGHDHERDNRGHEDRN